MFMSAPSLIFKAVADLNAGIGFMTTVAGVIFQPDNIFVGVLMFAINGMISMEL
jgi:ABC-type nitrate/sulfonate/bicarbonate transport system permease component